MPHGNFTNGALVLRIWRFDGSSELIAKFQYFADAEQFAASHANRHAGNADWFMLAVCENEGVARAVNPPPKADDRPAVNLETVVRLYRNECASGAPSQYRLLGINAEADEVLSALNREEGRS